MRKDLNQRIGDYVDTHADGLTAFLQQVVQSKSLWGDVAELGKLANLIHRRLNDHGVRAELQDSGTPGAPNVLGRVGDASTGRRLLFCGHFDVYPPSNAWSFDPWSAPIRGDKLHGPGSTDMKGGTTAMLMAATVLAALGEPKGGEMIVLPIPNHFEGGEGTRRALDAGLTAEAGIVCEPTDLDVCAAQRGILYSDITIKGVGAHTTYEQVGVNAIEPIIPIIQALKSPAFARPNHDEFGPEKIVNIALVQGGLRRCLIPAECVLTVDVRFSPSTNAAAVLEEMRAIVRKISASQKFTAKVEPQESCVKNPRSPMNWIVHPIRDRLAAAHESFVGSAPSAACHPAWPDTPVLNERGIPSITYGPGSKYCYWDEEFVPIPQYLQAIKVYASTAAHWFQA